MPSILPPERPAQLPEPYYSDDLVTLYHGDCLDVLPNLSGVDLVFTSPPYNLSGDGHSRLREKGKEFSALASGYGSYADDLPHETYAAWQRLVLRLCWASLSKAGAIYYNHKPIARGNKVRLPLDLIPADLSIRQIVIWDRGSGFNRNPTHYVPTHEWIMILAQDGFRITSRNVDDVWRISFDRESLGHPAPFPLGLPARAIQTTSAAVVLDPFAGSGTTLFAAKTLGRKAIGVELDEHYCEIAARRLAQDTLFGGVA